MAKVISVINLKGGVGKTQLTVALAEFASIQHDKKVLVIDLDPQTNASVMMMDQNAWLQRNKEGRTLVRLFSDKLNNTSTFNVAEAIVKGASNIRHWRTYRLNLLPSSLDLIALQDRLILIQAGHFYVGSPVTALKEAVGPVMGDYDLVLIDCPPNLGILTLNGLFMSDFYLIPVIPDILSTYGIPQIIDRVGKFKSEAKIGLEPLGIVISRYRSQAGSLHDQTIHRLKTQHTQDAARNPRVFDAQVREAVSAARAAEFRPVNTLKQKYGYGNNAVYWDYEAITEEFLRYVQ